MAAATVEDLLAHADDLVVQIQAEASRIVDEGRAMGLAETIVPVLAFLGFDEEASNWDALPQQASRFTDDEYPRLRDQAEAAGDEALARRLVDSAQSILSTMTGVGPVDDESANAVQFVKDVGHDLKKAAKPLLSYPVAGVAGVVTGGALAFVATGTPRAVIAGAAAGGLLGLGVRWAIGEVLASLPVIGTREK